MSTDYIRTFTWDKKLESWVKETGILGGGGRDPTIISPVQYKNRFRESMARYFLMVNNILKRKFFFFFFIFNLKYIYLINF